MSFYEVEDVTFSYTLGKVKVEALSQVSCQIREGEITCLNGPSGSGKSTLLNLLGLIEPIQQGNIRLLKHDFHSLSESGKNKIRMYELGFIFQSFHLFPVMNAEENVEYFLSRQGLPRSERKERVKESLQSVGLWEHRKKKPLEMSGGQRQRVAIARALAKRPKVILADEPTASLDQKTGIEIMKLFLTANQKCGTTLIISSHDPMVMSYCKTQLKLKDGRVVQDNVFGAVAR